MARTSETRIRRIRKLGPIGTVCGLLMASGVTLIGILGGLEPHVILIRASVSAVVFGMLVGFGLSVIQLANLPPANRSSK